MSSRPRPTTVKPMTVPAEKATFSPEFRLSRQALAVRALEAVAIFIPTKPLSPEKKPPVTKAKGTNQVRKCSAAMTHRMANMHAKNTRTTLYCRRRYALAPCRMKEAIFCICSVPSENERARFAINTANSSAQMEPRAEKMMKY